MRVGLIAMSGVRVINPRLQAAGVTLPGFVRRGEVIAQLPSLALITLAALTPDDVDIEYLEIEDFPSEEIRPTHFDLVGISSYTARAYDMYVLADWYREKGVAVVLGGLHVSQVPEEAQAHADAVCIGEAETLWPRIIADFRAGGRAGLQTAYREERPGHYDLADSPMPRYELLLGRRHNRITVQTVRGCPLDCEFCGASKLYGPKFRRKPVAKVMQELDRIEQLWGANAFVEFADDNSFGNPHWARELLYAMRGVKLRWFTETDISIADDDELLKLLFETGCRQLLIGFESIAPATLSGIDRAGWKRRHLERYQDAIRRIQNAGISVNGCFIVGNDGDTPAVFEELRDFIERSELLDAQITILTPFPGTRLLQRLQHEGRLLYEHFWDRCTLFDVVFEPKNMTVAQLEEGHMWLMQEVYGEERLSRSRRRYVDIMKRLRENATEDPASDGR